MTFDATLEAILFFKAEPFSVRGLATFCGVDAGTIERGLATLEKNLLGRGVALVRHGDSVELRTASGAASHIERLVRDELSGELGPAGAEVLALVLYRGHASRREIDWIRGVNSTFTLRELASRGLVRRVTRGKYGFVYEPTPELLAHLGVARVSDLPDYERARKELGEVIDETLNTAENAPHPPISHE